MFMSGGGEHFHQKKPGLKRIFDWRGTKKQTNKKTILEFADVALCAYTRTGKAVKVLENM